MKIYLARRKSETETLPPHFRLFTSDLFLHLHTIIWGIKRASKRTAINKALPVYACATRRSEGNDLRCANPLWCAKLVSHTWLSHRRRQKVGKLWVIQLKTPPEILSRKSLRKYYTHSRVCLSCTAELFLVWRECVFVFVSVCGYVYV